MKRKISTSTLLGNWKKNKLWNMKVTIIPIVIGSFGTVTKWLLKALEDLADEWGPSKLRTDRIENGQNTEKSPGDLMRLAVTLTSVKDHQLTLMRKILMNKCNNYDHIKLWQYCWVLIMQWCKKREIIIIDNTKNISYIYWQCLWIIMMEVRTL